MKTKQLKGFSLFELLTSIAVLLVLIISSLIFIPKQIVKAKDAKTKTNLQQISTALADYYDSKNNFPATLPDCNQPLTVDGKNYIPNIPCDPFDASSYLYIYGSDNSGKWFKLYAKLRNPQDKNIELAGCTYGCGPNCEYNYGISSSNTLIDRCAGPTPTLVPTSIPTATPTPVRYACSPGANHCDQYDNPVLSECPKVYNYDPTCRNECSIKANRCLNSAGKHKPE